MAQFLDQIQASKAVLIEVMNVLGLYREHLTLVGGWVPELSFPNRGHMGSLDVDLAVDVRGISVRQYDTILNRLLESGYIRRQNCFIRHVKSVKEPVKVDMITGEYVDDAAVVPARLQEISLGKLRGTDLAFECFDEISVSGEMPDGGANTVRLRIVRIDAFIIMKALAMADRAKPKDAYDIYFCLKNYPGGGAELVKSYGALLRNGLVQEGLHVLYDKFQSVDAVGPTWVAQVIAEESLGAPDLARREAFELMQAFLASLPKASS